VLIANKQVEYTAYITELIYAQEIIKQARVVANK
jgi:hypothetical protein